jgi:hypothetical protein
MTVAENCTGTTSSSYSRTTPRTRLNTTAALIGFPATAVGDACSLRRREELTAENERNQGEGV